jgi:hypothetical protein
MTVVPVIVCSTDGHRGWAAWQLQDSSGYLRGRPYPSRGRAEAALWQLTQVLGR